MLQNAGLETLHSKLKDQWQPVNKKKNIAIQSNHLKKQATVYKKIKYSFTHDFLFRKKYSPADEEIPIFLKICVL